MGSLALVVNVKNTITSLKVARSSYRYQNRMRLKRKKSKLKEDAIDEGIRETAEGGKTCQEDREVAGCHLEVEVFLMFHLMVIKFSHHQKD